jgi:hypothetical protein
MAVTIAHVKHNNSGSFYEHVCDVTGPGAYNAGGETLTAAELTALMPRLGGCQVGDWVKIQTFMSEASATGLRLAFNRTSGKLQWWNGGTEAAAGVTNVPTRVTVRYGNVGD